MRPPQLPNDDASLGAPWGASQILGRDALPPIPAPQHMEEIRSPWDQAQIMAVR